ncbi:hypothetical protein Avbf_07918, partial [Armadillidium vulgare]
MGTRRNRNSRERKNELTDIKIFMDLACHKSKTKLLWYTSEKKFLKYGKIESDEEGLKLFALNSLDKISVLLSDNNYDNWLNFAIEHYEDLPFFIRYENDEIFSHLKKILSGDFRLRTKYCSEIFYYERDNDNNNNIQEYNLVVVEDNSKLYIIPCEKNVNGLLIGYYFGPKSFLDKLFYSKYNYRLIDIYCTFRLLDEDVLDYVGLTSDD